MQTKVFYGWFIVAAGFVLLMCFAGSGFYSFGVFIEPLEAEFGWSRTEIALTISIYLLVSGMASPIVGRLVQTMGPKKVICMGAFGSSLCFFLISLSKNLLTFYLLYALLALTIIGIGYIPISTLIACWFDTRRGTATGLVYMGISAGGMIFAPLIGRISLLFGWRQAFIFLGLFVLVIAVPIAFLVIKERPGDSSTELVIIKPRDIAPRSVCHKSEFAADELSKETDNSLKEIVSTVSFRWLAITFFLGGMAMLAILQHQVAIMCEKGISYIAASNALGITSGMGGVGKFCFGRMTESMPLKWVVTICYVIQAVGVLFLFYLSSEYMVWGYAAIFGFGMGGVLVLQPLAVSGYYGLKSFGIVLGLISLGQQLGASFGAFSAGVLYDYFGSYHFAMLLFLGIYAAAVFSIFMAGNARERQR